jgi:hypothetical protein
MVESQMIKRPITRLRALDGSHGEIDQIVDRPRLSH